MKMSKRFFSALLAAAMVGQMGVVVGMATGGETATQTPACNHARPEGKTCLNGMHWIVSDKSGHLSGGSGTNYFYPKTGDSEIYCTEGATDIIIFTSPMPTTADGSFITITDFSTGDKIYVPGGIEIPTDGLGSIEEDSGSNERKLTLNGCDLAFQNSDLSAYKGKISIASMPPNTLSPSLEDEKGTITITPKDTKNEKYTYLWVIKQGSEIKSSVTNKDGTVPPIPEPVNPGIYTYTCTVIENATGYDKTSSLEKTVGCEYTPSFVTESIKATRTDTDGSDWVAGTPFELTADDAATYTFTLSKPVTYSGDYCDGTDGENHGYEIKWTKGEGFPAGVELTNDQLTVKASEVAAGTSEVKLSVSVGRTDAEGFKESIKKDNIVFTIEKAEKVNTGEDNKDPNKPGDGTTGGNQGNTGTDTDNKTEDEKPPQISINDETTEKEPVREIKIDQKVTKPVSYKYTANVDLTGNNSKYTVDWQLKKLLADKTTSDNLPDYIKYTSENNVATVTINEKLPAGTNDTFILTAKLADANPAKVRALAANTEGQANDQAGEESIEIKVTTPATFAGSNQDTGGPTTPACGQTIKSVTVTPKVSTLNVKEADLSTEPVIEWEYTVEREICNVTGCQHENKEDFYWVISTNGVGQWATAGDVNEKTGKLKITAAKIPSTKDNVITLRATTKRTGTGGAETEVNLGEAKITVTRDPKCERKLTKMIITSKEAGMDSFSVTKGQTKIADYFVAKEYSGTCEKDSVHSDMSNHGESITWSIESIKPEVKNAFEIGSQTGSLKINGKNLTAGGNYEVVIAAKSDGCEPSRAIIKVKCTAASSGSNSGSSGGSSSSKDDRDDSDWYQWQDFQDDISDARKGSTVKVNLRDNTNMPFYIFDEVRGKDVSLQMKVSGGYTWTVNGKSVKKLPENQVWVALGVKKYSNSKTRSLCRDYDIKSFELENNGSFYGDMRLTMNLGSSYAKKTVFLYSYDENKNKLTYNSSAKADESGDVDFVFARSLGAYVVTSKALYGESAVGTGGGTVGNGSGNTGTGSGNNPAAVYPPVASVPASRVPAASSSGSSSSGSSSESSSSSSEPAPPPAEPSSDPDVTPVDTDIEPEPEKTKIPVLVPLLILAIAGVVTATVLVVRSSKGKDDFDA